MFLVMLSGSMIKYYPRGLLLTAEGFQNFFTHIAEHSFPSLCLTVFMYGLWYMYRGLTEFDPVKLHKGDRNNIKLEQVPECFVQVIPCDRGRSKR